MKAQHALLFFLVIALAFVPKVLTEETEVGGTVRGEVTFQEEPVPGVQIKLTSFGSENREFIQNSDKDGLYLFSSVPPGSYKFEYSKEGFGRVYRAIEVWDKYLYCEDIFLIDKATLQKWAKQIGPTDDGNFWPLRPEDYEASARYLEGAVTFDGKPLYQVKLKLTDLNDLQNTYLSFSKSDGSYFMYPHPPGKYKLQAEKRGYLNFEEVIDLNAPNEFTFDFTLIPTFTEE